MTAAVIAYYEAKTASILAKYGPGPRVHYHSGIATEPPGGLSSEELRVAMHRAQERLLERVASLWPSGYLRDRHILDAGCGLGGSALFWAQEHRARVTAITNVPGHVARARSFVDAVGMSERVQVILRDAHEPVEPGTDIVLAVESSSYFARVPWFRSMSALLPGRLVVVVDCFISDESVARVFDEQWRTRVGTEQEYVRAAERIGMRLLQRTRLNELVAPFWDLSVAHSCAELERAESSSEEKRLRRSVRAHLRLRNSLESGAITYAVLVFGTDLA